MTPARQNIEIAKICGWIFRKAKWWEKILCLGAKYICISPDGKVFCDYVPNYSNNLNVMYKAALELKNNDNDLYQRYLFILRRLSDGKNDPADAPCSMRAEAFLKTFNKWV